MIEILWKQLLPQQQAQTQTQKTEVLLVATAAKLNEETTPPIEVSLAPTTTKLNEEKYGFCSQVDSVDHDPTRKGTFAHALMSRNNGKDVGWIIDSGATDHMTPFVTYFSHHSNTRRESLFNANGHEFPVKGAGTVELRPTMPLKNTLFVPICPFFVQSLNFCWAIDKGVEVLCFNVLWILLVSGYPHQGDHWTWY